RSLGCEIAPNVQILRALRHNCARKQKFRAHELTVSQQVHTSLASSVIWAFRTFDTGQFFSASPAIFANAASSNFGTLARSVKAERVIRNPCPSGSRLTAASVVSSVGVKPAPCSWKARAIVKHPACAAAISSSGFVPFSFSKRVRNEYGVPSSTPESLVSWPLPARPVPCQTAFALRIIVLLLDIPVIS